jgi:hypothetical protein
MSDLHRERSLDETLDQYWDAILAHDEAPPTNDLDPELAAAVRRVHALDRSPAPHPAFASTLWEDLMHASSASITPYTFAGPSVALPAVLRRPPVAIRAWREQGWSRLAAAILLVALLAGSIAVAFYPLRFRERSGLPMIASTTSPSVEATAETVFTAILPQELVPTADNLDFVVWRATIAPGARAPYEGPIQGVQILHVLDGALTLTADRPVQVFRYSAGISAVAGTAEAAPGTTIVLHADDSAVYAFDQKVAYANLGSTPVQLVAGGLFAGYSAWLPEEATVIDHNEQYPLAAFPRGPLLATLVQARMAPGAEVPAPPAGSRVLEVGAYGDANIASQMDSGLRNIGPREETIYVLTLTPAGAGTPASGPSS